MSRQYIFLKDRQIDNKFSRWLYYAIMNGYGSIDKFSYESGICKTLIYAWIAGDYRPGRKSLATLSKMFRVSVDELLQIMGED